MTIYIILIEKYRGIIQYFLKKSQHPYNCRESTTNKTQTLGHEKENLLQNNTSTNPTPYPLHSPISGVFSNEPLIAAAIGTDCIYVFILTYQISLFVVFFMLQWIQCRHLVLFLYKNYRSGTAWAGRDGSCWGNRFWWVILGEEYWWTGGRVQKDHQQAIQWLLWHSCNKAFDGVTEESFNEEQEDGEKSLKNFSESWEIL